MLAKDDRRICITVWCTFLLCALPGWGLFHVASKIQTEIQLDEGHLETTCIVMKFSRFEACCTQDAMKSKMTIIPGDGFKEGDYESCVPDGYYTHCFVTADGCSETHLSPKHFDHPPCLPHSTKVGDDFQCFASCQAKTFTMEADEANYHGMMLWFFVCALAMLVVTFSGSYLVMHFSHQDYLTRGMPVDMQTPLQKRRDPTITAGARSSFLSGPPTSARSSFLASPDDELTPPNHPMNDSGGSIVSFLSSPQAPSAMAKQKASENSSVSDRSFGGGAFDEWTTASTTTLSLESYEDSSSIRGVHPDLIVSHPYMRVKRVSIETIQLSSNSAQRSSLGGKDVDTTSTDFSDHPFVKKDPTRGTDSPRSSLKRKNTSSHKRRVTWSMGRFGGFLMKKFGKKKADEESPEYIDPEPPDPSRPRKRGLNGRRSNHSWTYGPSMDLSRTSASPHISFVDEPGRLGSTNDAAPGMTPSNAPNRPPPPDTPPPKPRISLLKERRSEVPRPPKDPPSQEVYGGADLPDVPGAHMQTMNANTQMNWTPYIKHF